MTDLAEKLKQLLILLDFERRIMTPVEAKKILQSAMMKEYQLTEVDYASLINAIIEMQQENAELKAKLKNAIVPKFKIGQEVWTIAQEDETQELVPERSAIDEITIKNTGIKDNPEIIYMTGYFENLTESELFASKEEAEASLKYKNND